MEPFAILFWLVVGVVVKKVYDAIKGRGMSMEEKLEKAGVYAVVDWSPAAHHMGVGQKMILLFNKGMLVKRMMDSLAKRDEYDDMGVPVIDATGGGEMPPEYRQTAPSEIIQNRMRLGWADRD